MITLVIYNNLICIKTMMSKKLITLLGNKVRLSPSPSWPFQSKILRSSLPLVRQFEN